MYIPAIGTQNNRTNFGAIFEPKNVDWNQAQKAVVDGIKKAMRKPLEKFNGQTAEGFYKEKKGLDFGFSPYSEDSVYLNGYRGIREIGVGKNKEYTYSESINIGEYGNPSEFDVSDINKGIKEHRRSSLYFATICAGLVLTAFTIAKFGGKGAKIEHTKPLIENVDSLADTAKTVLKDTAKVMNPFKK